MHHNMMISLQAAQEMKIVKSPQKRNSKTNSPEKPKENQPKSKTTRTKNKRHQKGSCSTTGTQTETDFQSWPFPFSPYPLNEFYLEQARLANEAKDPLTWNTAGMQSLYSGCCMHGIW